MVNQLDSIGEILKDKKEIDILKKRINNKRERHLQKSASYFSTKVVKDFQFLAEQGCIAMQAPLRDAEELVNSGLASYMKLDPKMNLENVEIDDSGRGIYTFDCKYKVTASGAPEQERYALIYMTTEEHDWMRQAQAKGFKEGYSTGGGGYKPGIDASMEAENEPLKGFTEEVKKKK